MADNAYTETLKQVGYLLFDPATIALVGCALGSITYGGYRSQQFYAATHSPPASGERRSTTTEQFGSSVSVVQLSTAIILPIFASVMLVVLFYFLNMIYYLLLIAILFGSFVSMCFVQWPLWELLVRHAHRLLPKLPTEIPTIKCIGSVPLEMLLSLPLPVCLIIGYLLTNHWAFTNVFAFCIIIFSLSTLRIPSMMVATLLLCIFFLYDFFWVFLSSFVFGDNVMVAVATEATSGGFHWALPLAIQIPMLLSDSASLLGVGDVVMPGLFLCFLYRFDCRVSGSPLRGYFINGLFGYVAGLWLALTMLVLTQMAQPALIYLVPCVLLPALVLAASRGQVRVLWRGGFPKPVVIDEGDVDEEMAVELEEMGVGVQEEKSEKEEDLVVEIEDNGVGEQVEEMLEAPDLHVELDDSF